MNKITILGRLGRDPESRFTSDGTKVTNLSVATSVYRKGSEDTIWWRVAVWGTHMDNILTHLSKGSAVVITGEISKKPELYTDKNGSPQVSDFDVRAESIGFSPFGGKSDQENKPQQQQNFAAATQQGTASASASQYDDEVPF